VLNDVGKLVQAENEKDEKIQVPLGEKKGEKHKGELTKARVSGEKGTSKGKQTQLNLNHYSKTGEAAHQTQNRAGLEKVREGKKRTDAAALVGGKKQSKIAIRRFTTGWINTNRRGASEGEQRALRCDGGTGGQKRTRPGGGGLKKADAKQSLKRDFGRECETEEQTKNDRGSPRAKRGLYLNGWMSGL